MKFKASLLTENMNGLELVHAWHECLNVDLETRLGRMLKNKSTWFINMPRAA